MSKILTLADGDTLEFTDVSTITRLQTVVSGSYAGVDALRDKLTEENLSHVTFGEKEYTDLMPVSCSAEAEAGQDITVTFINVFKTESEIEQLKQRVADLEIENAQLTDKAEAADILLGNEEVKP